ncbi:MAG: T9SS type A sorting domain-containing protein [Lentimicrobiaceae bacterium]|nr:T9SS type A sorting domain-containing protein [Lentimicrobiaceae bacterium]
MRKLLLICLALSIGSLGFAQLHRAPVSKQWKNYAVKKVKAVDETSNLNAAVKPAHKSATAVSEEEVGTSIYDLPTNGSTQNRLYRFDDGTIGATWTIGFTPTAYNDRGTGYNYFDGTAWGPAPTARIETVKTGWPSYAAWGANGECAVTHKGGTSPLVFETRPTKGSGAWTFFDVAAPTGATGYLWPRMVTGGTDNNTIHLLALTAPTGNSGVVYQGLDGALLYSRSTDGGNTWDIDDAMLTGLTSAEYFGFSGDTYTWAEPKGNTIAFVMGENSYDLILMKSTDNGTTWTKTVIWEHPIPFWNGTAATADTFYCPDGSHSIVIDDNGTCHIAFGVNRAHADDAGSYWFPGVGGVGYWKEGDATWTGGNQWEALDPDALDAQGKLIGYALDLNGNGTWDVLTDGFPKYYLGSSSMPQLVLNDDGRIILTYTMVMEGYDNGAQNYRHIWCRGTNDDGANWGDFIDVTGDIIHLYDECVFPYVAKNNDGVNFTMLWQADDEPGLSVRGDEDPPTTNRLVFTSVPFDDIILPPPPPQFLPPTNLQYTQNYNTINLTWGVPTTGTPQGYDVYCNGVKINTALITTLSYQNVDLGYGVYSYCAKAVYEGGTSECSNTVQATVLIKPTNLNAIAEIFNVNLTWDAPLRALLGYNIYRDGASTPVNASPVLFTNYTDVVPSIGTYIYTVKALYTEGESDASDPATAVVTSINDLASQGIKIFPNPVNGQLNVRSNSDMSRIVIVNHVGQVVYDGNVNNTIFSLNTSNLQSGVYMLRIYTAKGIAISKMIIE